jgi:hypothetical protein
MVVEFVYRGVSFMVCLYRLEALILLPADLEQQHLLIKNKSGVLRLVQEELGHEIKGAVFYRLA